MRATDGLQTTITVGPVNMTVRHSPWTVAGDGLADATRTSISPTRSRRTSIRPVSKSSVGCSKS